MNAGQTHFNSSIALCFIAQRSLEFNSFFSTQYHSESDFSVPLARAPRSNFLKQLKGCHWNFILLKANENRKIKKSSENNKLTAKDFKIGTLAARKVQTKRRQLLRFLFQPDEGEFSHSLSDAFMLIIFISGNWFDG